jgi:ribosome-associated protein
LRTKTLAKKIARYALGKKAHDVTIMDLRKVTDMADFFVICSADSDVQVKAVADAIADGTESMGISAWHSEGLTNRQWVLLDYVDIVVHVFHKEVRKYYGLEKLWGDAKIEVITDGDEKKPAAPRRRPARRR